MGQLVVGDGDDQAVAFPGRRGREEQHVRDLADGIAEESELDLVDRLAQAALSERACFLAHDGVPTQLTRAHEHLQDHGQRREFRDLTLDQEVALARIEAGGQQIERDLPHRSGEQFGALLVRRQRLDVGDEEEALMGILVREPLPDHGHVLAQMQGARRANARQKASCTCGRGRLVASHGFGRDGQFLLPAACAQPLCCRSDLAGGYNPARSS